MQRELTVAVLLSLLAVSALAQVQITLDASTSVHAVSPNLWGIFYEEINHAGVGGFYSQLIQNPLFQANTSSPWASSGCSAAGLDASQPLNSINQNAYALSVGTTQDCVITNNGYYGIAAKPNASYSLSFYMLLLPSQPVTELVVTVGLRSSNGATVYAEQDIVVEANSNWQKYSATLNILAAVNALDPTAVFFMSVPNSSATVKVWVQCVLLFPAESWRGLPYIRKDLGDMMAAMNPKIIRFPGGNYVEGNNIGSILRWKNTVGPVEERPGHQGTWGYWSPDHFGFFEELVFAETMGMEPVWVVNCGMTFGGMVPLDQIQPYVQDALDGIEFANGDASTKYGALRISLGHTKPFNLKYIAFGNEEDLNGYLPDYKLRYPLFYGNVSAAYPEMNIIANTIQVDTVAPVPIQEIHDYTTPEAYWAAAHEFDTADRSHPIFLSEYAVAGTWVSSNNTKNFYTFRAALGEAVFMIMMERNSDVVLMSCYAPLFVSSSNHGWDPDAITFNTYQSYGSPSYWNQVMFGSNPGAEVLKISYDDTKNLLQISATSRPTASNSTFEIVLKTCNYGAVDVSTTVTVTLPAASFGAAMMPSRHVRGHRASHRKASVEAGTWTLSSQVAATTMTSSDVYAVNSFTSPTAVAPVSSSISIVPQVIDATHVEFAYTFKANTIQILTFQVNQA